MKNNQSNAQKKALKNLITGYKKANEFILEEKKKRLPQLTSEESTQEYDMLCKIWETNQLKDGIEQLDKQKIAFLVERRKRLNKISKFRRNHESSI